VDDELVRDIEPGCPPPSRRFEAMRRLHAAGVPVAVLVSPVIPGLNDRDIPRVLERAVACGASDATLTPLRLPCSVQQVFLGRLRGVRPDSVRRVEQLVRDMRGGALDEPRIGQRMRGSGAYWGSILQLFAKTAARLGLNQELASGKPKSERRKGAARQLTLFGDVGRTRRAAAVRRSGRCPES